MLLLFLYFEFKVTLSFALGKVCWEHERCTEQEYFLEGKMVIDANGCLIVCSCLFI